MNGDRFRSRWIPRLESGAVSFLIEAVIVVVLLWIAIVVSAVALAVL